MQNFPLMQIQEGQGHLDQPVNDHLFREVFTLRCLDFCVYIAAITINHHDVEVLFSVNIGVFISDNVSVADFLKKSDLVFGVL